MSGWDGTRAPERCDALIIVPPFCELHYPSIGVHTIQATARAAGFEVRVFYANLHFAAAIGTESYIRLCRAFRGAFVGERLFAFAAYDRPLAEERASDICDSRRLLGARTEFDLYPDVSVETQRLIRALPEFAPQTAKWIEEAAALVASFGANVVGATSTFEQTAPAVSLLRTIKRLRPDTLAILGGANCEGEMADGLLAIAPFLDHVFSGESEATFSAFLTACRDGRPQPRVVHGSPCRDLDTIPRLDYDDYFAQRDALVGENDEALLDPTSLPYETSRGCWWGEKQHCTFCGLNGEGMAFRIRSVERTIADLRALTERYETQQIEMTDNIMPHGFFPTLLPRLAAELPGLRIFYEQKANMTRERLETLRAAGVRSIQPGIEALSTDLLRLMRKGVSGAQNVSLLRDARGIGLTIVWNLLWGFPNDLSRYYEETLALLPLLTHLQPPGGFWPVMIDRFSPYFETPEAFGIRNVRPIGSYFDILPDGAPAQKIAYHFEGDFECESYHSPRLLQEIADVVVGWKSAWAAGKATELRLGEFNGSYVLIDTRGLVGTEDLSVLDEEEAQLLLASRRFDESAEQRSMLERKIAVCVDDRFVPLAVIDPRTYAMLESRCSRIAERSFLISASSSSRDSASRS